TKQDAGTWTLSGANTYTGATTVSAGVLKAGHANAFGPTSGAGAITVSSGAALDLNGKAIVSTGSLTLNGTGISSGGALMNSGAAASYAGLVALGSDSSIIGGSGTIALGNTGTINGSGKNLTLGGAQGGSMAGIIGTGAGTLTKQDAGTWSLNGVNTFTGMVTVNAGTLQIATDRGLGAVPASAAVALTLNGGTLTANNSIDVTLNANRLIAIGSNGGSIVNAGTSTSTLALEGAIGGATVGSVTQGPLTITGGDIRIGASISMGAYDLLVKSTGNIFQGVAAINPTPANIVVSAQGTGTVTYWADSDASGAGAIQLNAGSSNTVRSSITTAGGNIVLGGGAGATAADGWARGLYAVNLGDYSNLDAGTGSITLKGMTNASSFGGTGVLIETNSTLTAGTIRITGNGNPSNTSSDFGVRIKGGTSVTASSLVNIAGTGGGTASSAVLGNSGVRIDNATVSATGSGNVVITGDGGGNSAGGTNYGIQLLGNSSGSRSSITADTGTITITGIEGAGTGGIGISATVAGIGAASQTGLITVRANSVLTGSLSTAANNSQVLSSGVVNMEPLLGSASFTGRAL
ncbi:MAG: hypothetical protein EBU72_13855, partial [Betaproteobacteria bacterium]|nr:hypothetical protein [Betaproteobacteria bacterium]